MNTPSESRQAAATRSILNVPNVLSGIRVIGSPCLVVLAFLGWYQGLATLAIVLVATDWLDGFLARTLHEETTVGARLDSIADALFYICVLIATAIADWQLIRSESPWIGLAIVSYLASLVLGWIKFRCFPSYHSWLAKGAWVVVGIGVIAALTGISNWPLRAAMLFVTVANFESILITRSLHESRTDVPTLWHARKL